MQVEIEISVDKNRCPRGVVDVKADEIQNNCKLVSLHSLPQINLKSL